jgi:hypothetical protein
MYEKPQYLTSKGFKRASASSGNDTAKGTARGGSTAEKRALQEKKKKLLARRRALLKSRKPGQISDKAARLIAEAIKSMLRE